MTSLIHRIFFKCRILKTNKFIDTENRLEVARGGGTGEK